MGWGVHDLRIGYMLWSILGYRAKVTRSKEEVLG
jgi:hypothetical protein